MQNKSYNKFKQLIQAQSGILKELVLLVSLALVVVLVLFFFLRSSEYVTITLRVSSSDSLVNHWFNRAPQWYLEALQPGKATTDLFGQTSIEIIDTYYYPNYGDFETLYVTARVRALYSSNTNEYSYNGDPLLIGQFIKLSVGGSLVPGVIHSIQKDSLEQDIKEVTVFGELEAIHNNSVRISTKQETITELEGIRNFLVDSITQGISVKDSNGNVYFEILKVEKQPAYKTSSGNNTLVRTFDTDRTRVFLTAKVNANVINGNLFYVSEYPLRKNIVIPVYLEDTTVYLTLYDVQLSQQ